MNAFISASIRERNKMEEIFIQRGITAYEFSDPDSFDSWDFKFTAKGNDFIGDIKIRNIKSTDYDEALINAAKIKYLREEGSRTGRLPVIVCSYTDGVTLCWLIHNYVGVKKMVYTSRTTAVAGEMIWREMRMLSMKNAHKLQ